MAEVKNFVYCLDADNYEGKTNITGVLRALTPEYIPGLYSFSISFSILGLEEGEYKFGFAFKDPQGQSISSIENVLMNCEWSQEKNLPEKYKGVDIILRLQNMDLKVQGVYNTEVWIDDEKLGEFPIFAKGENEK